MNDHSNLNRQLFQAVRDDDIIRVDQLLQSGADIEAIEDEGSTPLHLAAIMGQTRMARHLIARGANLNATNTRGGTTLTIARAAYTLATRVGRKQQASELLALIQWLRQQGAVDAPSTEPGRWWQFWK